jgi:hypothetical protein
MEQKKVMGRPRYSTMEVLVARGKAPATWKEDILDLGERGKNKIHYANYLNISRDTLYKIMDRDPNFADTIKRALDLSQQWWIDRVGESFEEGKSQKVNAMLWRYMMENTFRKDWRPAKEELDITTNGQAITDNSIVVEIVKEKKDKEQGEGL